MSENNLRTIQKCQKIINFYDDIEPRKYCAKPFSNTKPKLPYHLPKNSASKSSSGLKRDFSFSGQPNQQKAQNMSYNSSSSKYQNQRNKPFVSPYSRESRFDKIMKLKVKNSYQNITNCHDKTKKSILNSSLSSMKSSRSRSQNNKQNVNKNRKESRLDKIMKIKVVKPKVNSTLIYYEPRSGSKSVAKERKESKTKEWKESIKKIKKVKDQEDKEDRLWRIFERERELREKLRRETTERELKQQRRKQKRFELMVSREVTKIEQSKQILKRRTEGFSNYVYPSC